MFGHITYLIWLVLFLGIPLICLFLWGGRICWRERRALGWVLLGASCGGWAWDLTAVRLGFWFFNEDHLLGLDWLGLPIEEWLWIWGVALLFGGLALVWGDPECDPPRSTRGKISRDPKTQAYGAFEIVGAGVLLSSGNWFPAQYSQFVTMLAAAVVLHGMLWARNGPFLAGQWQVLLRVTAAAVIWLLVSDPVGALWGAWYYDSSRVIGIWLFGLIPIEDLVGSVIVGSVSAAAALVFAYGPRKWL